jgi:hypothetical protein
MTLTSKLKFPLVIAAVATLATPILAQDVSDMLNPRAMIAEMGLGDILQRTPGAASGIAAPRGDIASLRALPTLDTTVLSSPRPLLRPAAPDLATIARPSTDLHQMLDAMDLAEAAAPAGANTLVISGADTAVVAGTNTAIIQNGGTAPRVSLWQRLFGN